ncbi:MAG: class I SAM-dependent rRNA methyltransferase [Hyphomicrobiales bacterium]
MMNIKSFPKLILRDGKDAPLKRFHPWIYSGAVDYIEGGEPQEGDVVEVHNSFGDFMGLGHFQNNTVAVKIFAFEPFVPDYEFWKERILSAYQLRERLGLTNSLQTNAYRLVSGEADLLPGLKIDYFNGTIVFQASSLGMYNLRHDFTEILKELYGDRLFAIYDKSGEFLYKNTGISTRDSFLYGEDGPDIITENGAKFYVDYKLGQNTGYFLDHRNFRKIFAQYCKNKRVLDTFAYTGSYTINALKAGAKLVHSIDCSQISIEQIKKNVMLNDLQDAAQESFNTDSRKYMVGMPEDMYDVIVIDPPQFAKTPSLKGNAIKSYKKLNNLALKKIKKGGMLFTFSASTIIETSLFKSILFNAALDTNRKISIVHHFCQQEDHPINLYHPEGEYLKGLALYVE